MIEICASGESMEWSINGRKSRVDTLSSSIMMNLRNMKSLMIHEFVMLLKLGYENVKFTHVGTRLIFPTGRNSQLRTVLYLDNLNVILIRTL